MGPTVLAVTLVAVALAVAATPAAARQSGPEDAKAVFSSLNDSGVDGSAQLAADGDGTRVEIWADGAMGDHPTHIHQGTCDDLDPNPEFPLTNVQLRTAGLTGTSETTVDVPLSDLLDEPHLILIHRSEQDIGTYLACGDIVAGRLSAAEQRLDESNDPLPSTGAGPGAAPGGRSVVLVLLAAVAALVGGASTLLGRPRAAAVDTAGPRRRRPVGR